MARPITDEETLDPIVPPAPEPAAAPGAVPVEGTAGPVAAEPPEDARRRRRRRRRWIVLGVVAALLVATGIGAATIKVPYYRFAPGTLYPTEQLISVQGSPTYGDDGQIAMTTVSSRRASLLDEVLCGGIPDENQGCRFDSSVEMIAKERIDGDGKPEDTQRVNQELMDDSKHIAAVVALRTLGYPVKVEGTGALVRGVSDGTPASGVLKPDDTILAVDGTPVQLADQAVAAIGAKKPGDTITFTVERPIVGQLQVPITLAPRPDDAARGFVGVSLGTRNLHYALPFDVDIDSKKVTGPSGGLAFTLGVIDVLTPGSLTGGRSIAATGTIDADGVVGPVGGVRQKIAAARRDGVAYFLVPVEEYDEARTVAGDLDVVSVHTIDDALRAVAARGGNTQAVEQAAGTTIPH